MFSWTAMKDVELYSVYNNQVKTGFDFILVLSSFSYTNLKPFSFRFQIEYP